jgi:hypothetical protein
MLIATVGEHCVERNYHSIFVSRRDAQTGFANVSEESTLGIKVKPSDVRLNPGPNDPYTWKVLPERRGVFSEIFSKNLSQQSVNGYRTLCEGVGVAFEAVFVSSNETNTMDAITSVSKVGSRVQDFPKNMQLQTKGASFSGKIAQLQDANSKLCEEIDGWREKASAESERAKVVEEELCKWCKINQQLQEQINKLQDQVNSYAATIEYLRSILSNCFQGLGSALPVLEEVKKGVSIAVS